jgi:hypothetical protein
VKVSEKETRKKRATGTQMQSSSTRSWAPPMPGAPVRERPKYEYSSERVSTTSWPAM